MVAGDEPHGSGDLLGPGGTGLAARLERWVAEARVAEAARLRARSRWLDEHGAQEATLLGVLHDLAERGAAVALRTTGGRTVTGEVEVIGADFTAIRGPTGVTLVPLGAVTSLRTAPGVPASHGGRGAGTELALVEVLHELAADRERVLVVTGDDGVRGALRAAGRDVLVVRTDGDPPAPVYVPLAAVREVVLA